MFFTEAFNLSEHDQISKVIRREAPGLAQKFHEFYQTFPENERVNLAEFIPTVEGVIDQVKQIHLNYEAKRRGGITGKINRYFHRFCDTINTHKSLLGILPEGNEYISMFTGVLHVIIQVCPVINIVLSRCKWR